MISQPLNDGFGVEIAGIDLNDTNGASIADLRRLFHDNQLMVIRGQDITPDRFLWFAKHFGTPQPHIVAHLRHKEVPEILPLSNIFVDDKPIGIFDGAAFWHQDMAYEEVPSNATIVHALEVPEKGGETLFADMWGAYDSLDDALRGRLEGLVARHRYGNRADEDFSTRSKAMELTEEEQKEVRDVFHPVVLKHPMTGRKGLYGVTSTSRGIVGMEDAAARTLLDGLAAHCAQDQFVRAHYYSVGDIILWDNFSLMHKATLIDRADGPGTRRYLHRISTKGALRK